MRKIAKEHYWTLAVFLMDYQSGQASRGYRLLCRLRLGGQWSRGLCNELRDTDEYLWLERNYANRV